MSKEENPWFQNWPNDVPKNLSYPEDPLFALLTQAAKKHPKNPAIAYNNKETSYEELNVASNKFAVELTNLGVEKGDCVALFLPNIPEFIIAYYGLLKTGAVLTTISPLHREREVEYQLTDSEAKVIVTLDSLFPLLETIWQKTRLQHAILTVPEQNENQSIVGDKPILNGKVHSFQHLLKQTEVKPPKVKINPSRDIAALQYTGGTTGKAKAAMLTHRNLISNAVAFAAWIKGTPSQETFLTALPLFHIYGMTTSLNVPVSLAAKMVLIPKFEPKAALEAIQKHKATVFCGVPTIYQALIANPVLEQFDLTSIRVCISGASPLPPEVQKKFMQITGGLLAEGYGLTEASPVTHCSPVDKTLKTVRVGSIGLPLPDTKAKIVDVETGTKTLPIGEEGELAVKGPQIMKGYWRQPDETAQVLHGEWLLTGDIARMDAEGYFYITDRKKDLIKYKDYSVYPREIEDVLYEHSAVKLCAVVGKADQKVGEIPKAYIVLKEGTSATAKEIIDFVNGKIASYKAIREVEFRKDLPLSSAGKVLRRSLRAEDNS